VNLKFEVGRFGASLRAGGDNGKVDIRLQRHISLQAAQEQERERSQEQGGQRRPSGSRAPPTSLRVSLLITPYLSADMEKGIHNSHGARPVNQDI